MVMKQMAGIASRNLHSGATIGKTGRWRQPGRGSVVSKLQDAGLAALLLGACLLVAGCQTTDLDHAIKEGESAAAPAEVGKTAPKDGARASNAIVLREGDVVKVVFPAAPNLNTTQQIRRDGKIALPLVGELTAAGATLTELEGAILKLYASQLVSKEVNVTLESSFFPVFVTGAVVRPGKIMADRPLTALEAIMEAGGFDYIKANLKAVLVIRHEEGQVKHFRLNLKLPLQGKPSEPFNLKPSDIVYVPERFSFF